MREAILAVALLCALTASVSVVPSQGESASGDSLASFPGAVREAAVPAAYASDFALEPADGEWLRFSPSSIRIRLLNTSLGIVPEASALGLDGDPRTVTWSDYTSILEATIDGRLADGMHAVQAHLVHGDASVTELEWSFGLDTLVPNVEVDPLPPVTTNLDIELRGRARDAWLAGVTILGREVPLDAGNFTTQLRLWPGLNDVVVEARDLAGNLGRVTLVIALETLAFEGDARHLVVENASFAIDIPAEWAAQEGVRLPSGNRADLIALAPLQPGLETSVIVASERTSYVYSDFRALEWMDLVVAGVASSGQLKQVVGQPRLVDDPPGTVAVQSTFLRQTASTEVAFMQVTMVWSRPHRTQWVLLASADERRAVQEWPALNATVASFDVVGEGIVGPEDPDRVFFEYTIVVVGAMVALVAIATVALLPSYLSWRGARRARQWRPPRNWRL